MTMPRDDLSDLRAAVDSDRGRLADSLGLRRDGRRYFCSLCQSDGQPHATGDFSVEAGFKCHRCGWTGDGFGLVQAVRNCDFPAAVAFVRSLYSMPATRPPDAARTARKALPTWATIEEAAAAFPRLSRRLEGATVARVFTCYEADGTTPRGAEVRYRMPDGSKECRPFRFEAGRWHSGAPETWTLYGVRDMPDTGPVYLPEGPKCREAMHAAGLPAVASFGGASGARKTDWTAIRGRDVILLPDADEPGEAYAKAVAKILHKMGCSVRIRRLPGLGTGEDVADYLARGGDAETVERLAREAQPWTAPETAGGASVEVGGVDAIRAALWEISQAKLSATEAHRKSADAVVQWLHARGRFYHHTERRDFASVLYFDNVRKLLLPVQGDAFLAWMSDCLSVNRSERVFQFVASAVETEGLSARATPIEPAAYWSARPGAIYLSNGPGSMVRITGEGVETVDNGADGVLFPVGACLDPWTLTDPRDPFECCALFRDMATAAPHGRDLFRLWATALPTDPPCKPPACVTAPAGAGKTALIRGLFRLFGLPEQVATVARNGESDFWAGLDGGGLYCLDNADVRIDWLPDAAASAATAGVQLKRRLYTDADKVVLRARAWLAITSLNPTFASDAGLADRLVVVRLNRREGETAEAALFNEVDRHRDAGLSWIAATLSAALADGAPVPARLNQRHPDWASMGVRIGRAIGREAEAVAALRAAEADKSRFNLENDGIGAALLELLQAGPFEGGAGDLLEALIAIDPSFEGKLSGKRLGKRLDKLWPHVESTLDATKERDSHTKNLRYSFRPPESAVFAVFEEPISEKSPTRENYRTFAKTPLETPQTPQGTEPWRILL